MVAPTTYGFTLKFFDFFLPLGGPGGNEGETGAGAREGPEAAACNQQVVLFHVLSFIP